MLTNTYRVVVIVVAYALCFPEVSTRSIVDAVVVVNVVVLAIAVAELFE